MWILPKLIYRHNAIPRKIMAFLKDFEQSYVRVYVIIWLYCGYAAKSECGRGLVGEPDFAVVPRES